MLANARTTYAWVLAVLGISSILFGVAAVVWPAITLVALVILFGAYVAVAGVLSLIAAVDAGSHHLPWWPALLIALVDLGAAAVVLTQPGLTAISLVYVVAFWAIFKGGFEIVTSLVTARFLWLVAGVLALIAGFVLLSNPQLGALALVLVIGISAIARGVILLVEAIRGPEISGLRIF